MSMENASTKQSLIEWIAQVCHQANKVWCLSQGDNSQADWNDAPEWQKQSAIQGVLFRFGNPDAPASGIHDNWSKEKLADGWVYGETKDAEKKTHPCLVPFEELPLFQQKKDKLFSAIVDALK